MRRRRALGLAAIGLLGAPALIACARPVPRVCPEIAGEEGLSDPAGREEAPLHPVPARTTLKLLVLGQSQAVNIAFDSEFVPPSGVENFNFYNGRNYVAADPLLGTAYTGGNFATRLGSKLIEANRAQRVVIANGAVAGTSSLQWMPNDILGDRPRFIFAAMKEMELVPDAVLFQQGESDAVENVSANLRADRLRAIVRNLRDDGMECPFFVADSTVLTGAASSSQRMAVREGNRLSLSDSLGIFLGPDADAIGFDKRQADQTHFTAAGIDELADMWMPVLSKYF